MNKTNIKVDGYFRSADKWQAELQKLRAIVLDCDLAEELKWGCPCYTLEKRNIVLIHAFKEYCALLFFKGALMKDPHKILIQQTKNVQAARQIRFTNLREITKQKNILTAYIHEAIAVEQSGQKVRLKKPAEYAIPEELQDRLSSHAALKTAFGALTPGRQRGYLLYFSAAKQSKTRESRVKKCVPRILKGKGLDDE